MDKCEQLAKEYLDSLFENVVFEPRGKSKLPDFSCNGTVAVEVRRLNQNEFTSGRRRGLEETAITINKRIKLLFDGLEPSDSEGSWYVTYSFHRPIPEWRVLRSQIKKVLSTINLSSCVEIEAHPNFKLSFMKAKRTLQKKFVLIGNDLDIGGFVAAEIFRNVITCIEEKDELVTPYLKLYDKWWLLLVDLTHLAPAEEERNIVRTNLSVTHHWEKILVLNPNNSLDVWEIQ